MALISLIHPSRGRALKSFENSKKWIDNAGCDVQFILSLDFSDKYDKYFEQYSNATFEHKVIVNDNKSAVDAINHGAMKATGDILIVVSDDTDCPKNWAVDLLKCVEGKNDWIAKTHDGIQKWIITMPIMDRVYYNRFGYIYHPDYLHMFCDTELSCVADLTGRRIDIDINFPHNHYSVGKSVKDSISDKADKTWQQGESLFLKRMRNKFELKEVVGKISDPSYLNWARSKGVTI